LNVAGNRDELAMAAQARAEGKLAEAEQLAWSALAGTPNHARTLHLLGLIAKQKGDLEQAIDYLNRALLCDGSQAAAWHDLGDVHFAAGDAAAAAANYEQALRLRPDWGLAYNSLGVALQSLGRWSRAEECHRQALHLLPESPQVHNDLANALKAQQKMDEAATGFAEALRLEPENPKLAYNLGTTLQEMGRHDQAVGYYRQALARRPDNPDASNNLATALKELGLFEECAAQLLRTLKLQPDHALAYYNLSELAAAGAYQFTPEQLRRVQARAESERLPELERSLCAFAAAAVLNKQGDFDQAFRYYQRANDLRHDLLVRHNVAFDAASHAARVDRIIATYDRPYFERVQNWGTDTDLPIFIVGMPRSGSTLVEQILASHPQVFGGGEIGEIDIAPWAPAAGTAAPVLPDRQAAQDMAAAYLQGVAALSGESARATIKNLENFLHLGVIATLFPRARIIHCRRDPLDLCLSCYFQNFQQVHWACRLDDIAAYYRSYEKIMAHWSRILPMPILNVRYEDLIQHQEAVTRELLAWCGLKWDEHCLSFWKTRRVVRTASTVQVRQPISEHAIGRWRHYRKHLGPLIAALRAREATQSPALPLSALDMSELPAGS
jgi:tetratricopeptide (TPR) repeat protein